MAYPPSSTISHFKKTFSLSNLNDWYIADGVFFVIRCIILLSNKIAKINQVNSKSCSVARSVCKATDNRH